MNTARLQITRLHPQNDAAFILELLNEPAFLENIGDKRARTLADATAYITSGPVASFAQHGFGLCRVALGPEPIGICGLLKRDSLPDPDLGFAFLELHWSRGYATESATAILDDARSHLGLKRILAITSPTNAASGRVLEKVGLRYQKTIQLPAYEQPSRLYVWEEPSPDGPKSLL